MKTIKVDLPDSVYTLANQKAKLSGQSVETALQQLITLALLSTEEDAVEDYCLHKAMHEATDTPLLS